MDRGKEEEEEAKEEWKFGHEECLLRQKPGLGRWCEHFRICLVHGSPPFLPVCHDTLADRYEFVHGYLDIDGRYYRITNDTSSKQEELEIFDKQFNRTPADFLLSLTWLLLYVMEENQNYVEGGGGGGVPVTRKKFIGVPTVCLCGHENDEPEHWAQAVYEICETVPTRAAAAQISSVHSAIVNPFWLQPLCQVINVSNALIYVSHAGFGSGVIDKQLIAGEPFWIPRKHQLPLVGNFSTNPILFWSREENPRKSYPPGTTFLRVPKGGCALPPNSGRLLLFISYLLDCLAVDDDDHDHDYSTSLSGKKHRNRGKKKKEQTNLSCASLETYVTVGLNRLGQLLSVKLLPPLARIVLQYAYMDQWKSPFLLNSVINRSIPSPSLY